MLTFKDDSLIARLRTEFVPVTANTQELQWHRSPAQAFYLALVARTQSETLRKQFDSSLDPQGMYILGADGTPYGFTNDHEPADIQRFMHRGLREFRKHPPKGVAISDAEIAAPWTARPPEGSAIVRVFARIRPLPTEVWGLNRSVGRDFFWIYPEELTALHRDSGGTRSAAAGTSVPLPPNLVARLVRFHLVDDVRGTPDRWTPREVHRADFRAEVVRQVGEVRTLLVRGDFSMLGKRRAALGERDRVPQGYRGTFEGELDLAVSSGRLLRMRGIATGQAWGEGTYTPLPPPGNFRLLVAFVEAQADDTIAKIVPPEGVSTAQNDSDYHRAAEH